MIALTVLSGLLNNDSVYFSTASVVSGSRADVGSRSAGDKHEFDAADDECEYRQ